MNTSSSFGLYGLGGQSMPVVQNSREPLREPITPSDVYTKLWNPASGVQITASLSNSAPWFGSVSLLLPSTRSVVNSGTEVVVHNAYYSGSEVIEVNSRFSGSSMPINMAWADRYLSKQSGKMLRYLGYYRVPNIDDVFRNPPDTAPSASAVIASSLGYPQAQWVNVGTLGSTVDAGTGAVPIIILNPTVVAHVAILATALSGNIIKVTSGPNSFSAVVNSGTVSSNQVLFAIPTAGYSSRSVSFAPGSTVQFFSLSTLSSSVSGVYFNDTYYAPAMIPVDVLYDDGKIRDVRAWIEMCHDYRNRTDVLNNKSGLQSTAIALRSPNSSFRSAHPLWNASSVRDLPIRTTGGLDQQYYGIPGLLQNSYLLWSGHMVESASLADSINPSGSYHTFDFDIDMRTIFWDGSQNKNPKDMSLLFPSSSIKSLGIPRQWNYLLTASNYPSPTYGAIAQGLSASMPVGASGTSLEGSVIPWMAEPSLLPQGGFTTIITGSIGVPPGWATSSIYFQPTGSNLGPNTIRPVYPLLDDVYSFKVLDVSASVSGGFSLPFNRNEIRGFRPGLRGTSINGTWNFLFGGTAGPYNSGYTALSSSGIWIRQVRLEFIVDSNQRLWEFIPSRSRKWLKSTLVPGPDGYQNFSVISGAAAWDAGVSLVQFNQAADYGRTVSISQNRSATSYAVLSVITGTLKNRLESEGVSDPSWFLQGNGFGTPYIPDSSMSLGNVSAEEIDASASADIYSQTIGQTTTIPNANTLPDYLNRENYSLTTEQIWLNTLASGGLP